MSKIPYSEFIRAKLKTRSFPGFKCNSLPDQMFDWQRQIVDWACRKGRASIFADCGLGKTIMQLAWANNVPGRVLILAPLAVAEQTVREGKKFDIEVYNSKDGTHLQQKIIITNYERLHHFDCSQFDGIVLDESSILKSYTGKIRNQIIEQFADTKYKLACTATPSPNDFMELGNHSEFMGALSRTEMLAMYFIHDGGDTAKWRLKGHGQRPFWDWLASWSIMLKCPSDMGADSKGFKLPAIKQNIHVLDADPVDGYLFAMEAQTLSERRSAMKNSLDDRVQYCADKINASKDINLVWCNYNDESAMLTKAIEGAVEIKGSDTIEQKEERLKLFSQRRSDV